MRYRLRTLLITATIGPPLLAAAMWFAGYGSANPILLFAAGYISLIVVLLVVSSIMEAGNAASPPSFHGNIAAGFTISDLLAVMFLGGLSIGTTVFCDRQFAAPYWVAMPIGWCVAVIGGIAYVRSRPVKSSLREIVVAVLFGILLLVVGLGIVYARLGA
jgi:hypothetical protein